MTITHNNTEVLHATLMLATAIYDGAKSTEAADEAVDVYAETYIALIGQGSEPEDGPMLDIPAHVAKRICVAADYDDDVTAEIIAAVTR